MVRASTFHRLATVALVGVALMGHVVVEAGVVLPPGRDVPGAVDVQQGQGPYSQQEQVLMRGACARMSRGVGPSFALSLHRLVTS